MIYSEEDRYGWLLPCYYFLRAQRFFLFQEFAVDDRVSVNKIKE